MFTAVLCMVWALLCMSTYVGAAMYSIFVLLCVFVLFIYSLPLKAFFCEALNGYIVQKLQSVLVDTET